MQFVSLFIDEAGQVRCCRAQDKPGAQNDAPQMFEADGTPIPLVEVCVGAVETSPGEEHPVNLIPQRYEVAIQDDGPVLRLKPGAQPVAGITWGFPRAAADVPAWLEDQGFATLPAKVRARVNAAPDKAKALRESGIKSLADRCLHRVPLRLRAWLTLHSPAVALSCGLDAGVSNAAMLHAERNRIPPAHPFRSRLADLEDRIAEDKRRRRAAVFKSKQARQRMAAERETLAGIDAAQRARGAKS